MRAPTSRSCRVRCRTRRSWRRSSRRSRPLWGLRLRMTGRAPHDGSRPGARVAVVTGSNVTRHHLAATDAALARGGLAVRVVTVPPGEASKSFEAFERLCEALIEARIERRDLVVALGGGVVGDLAGFAAAVVRRGLDYVQVPTTLLAQVDSSVGGKTAIDSR